MSINPSIYHVCNFKQLNALLSNFVNYACGKPVHLFYSRFIYTLTHASKAIFFTLKTPFHFFSYEYFLNQILIACFIH